MMAAACTLVDAALEVGLGKTIETLRITHNLESRNDKEGAERVFKQEMQKVGGAAAREYLSKGV